VETTVLVNKGFLDVETCRRCRQTNIDIEFSSTYQNLPNETQHSYTVDIRHSSQRWEAVSHTTQQYML